MSYCRSNGEDSDVYLIGTRDYLDCMGAGWEMEDLKPVHRRIMVPSWTTVDGKLVQLDTQHEHFGSFTTTSRTEMIQHLNEHRAAGHKVPDRAFERLADEIATVGDLYE